MIKLDRNEMLQINAGSTISGTLVNAIWTGAKVFVDIGRYAGSAIRRFVDKNLCRY